MEGELPSQRITEGVIWKQLLFFFFPILLGSFFQQMYNTVDTIIVGRFVGTRALAAVGSAFTLMTFLTSILLGLAMGSGTVFSIKYGQKDDAGLKEGILASFVLLAGVTAVLVFAVYAGFDGIIWFLRIPAEIDAMMRTYLRIVFVGLAATFLYNYFASLLRALGNSVVPLVPPRRPSLHSTSPARALHCTPGSSSRCCGRPAGPSCGPPA